MYGTGPPWRMTVWSSVVCSVWRMRVYGVVYYKRREARALIPREKAGHVGQRVILNSPVHVLYSVLCTPRSPYGGELCSHAGWLVVVPDLVIVGLTCLTA